MNRQQFYARQLVAPSDLVLEFNNFESRIRQLYSDIHSAGVVSGGECTGVGFQSIAVSCPAPQGFIAWASDGDRISSGDSNALTCDVITTGNIPLPSSANHEYLGRLYIVHQLDVTEHRTNHLGTSVDYYFTDGFYFAVDIGAEGTIAPATATLPALRTDTSVFLCSFGVHNDAGVKKVVNIDWSQQDRKEHDIPFSGLTDVTAGQTAAFIGTIAALNYTPDSSHVYGTFTGAELDAINEGVSGVGGTAAVRQQAISVSVAFGSFTAAELKALNDSISGPSGSGTIKRPTGRPLDGTTAVAGAFNQEELNALAESVQGSGGSSPIRQQALSATVSFGSFTADELKALNDALSGPAPGNGTRNHVFDLTHAAPALDANHNDALDGPSWPRTRTPAAATPFLPTTQNEAEAIWDAAGIRATNNPGVMASGTNPFVGMTADQIAALFNPDGSHARTGAISAANPFAVFNNVFGRVRIRQDTLGILATQTMTGCRGPGIILIQGNFTTLGVAGQPSPAVITTNMVGANGASVTHNPIVLSGILTGTSTSFLAVGIFTGSGDVVFSYSDPPGQILNGTIDCQMVVMDSGW